MNKHRVKENFIRFILLWCGSLLFLVYSPVFGAIPAHERAALIALYNSTNGDDWRYNNGWKTPPLAADGFALPGTENTWRGITCNSANTSVYKINFNYNNLDGALPPELGNLSNLQYLEISNNYTFSGSIPAELGNLTNLISLELSWNNLSGDIPPELSNLTNLQHLELFEHFSGSIPPQLGNLTNLQYLGLYGYFSGSIPPELGNLTNLQYLDLSWNNLNGSIPLELGNLTNLQDLNLSWNNLSGSIPPELGNMANLQYLDLSWNNLNGSIPLELGNMANLQYLELSYNNLNGSIPPEFGNLIHLQDLYLNSNNLSGSIPQQLGNMTNLACLYLHENNLSGSIPAEFGNLTNLRHLYLSGNNLSGSIPQQLGDMSNLACLYLHMNNLSGSIPAEFGNLTNLRHLYLSGNNLSGSIPPEFGNLAKLLDLYLDNNRLSGSIPPELGNLTNLYSLYLHGNRLRGVIPDTLQNLVNLGWEDDIFSYYLNICWNALHTDNQELREFIDLVSDFRCDWEANQTLPPGRISASAASPCAIDLHWKSVAYQANPGCYRVFYRADTGRRYEYFGKTADKSVTSMTVDGLKPDTTYYFKLQTRTYPHADNKNTVDSDFSEVVSASTSPSPSQAVIPISGIVTCNGARLAGVSLALSRNGGTFTTDADGYYIAAVKQGWSGTITPGKKNYKFTPAYRSYTKISAEKIDQDFEAVPQSTITNRLTSNK